MDKNIKISLGLFSLLQNIGFTLYDSSKILFLHQTNQNTRDFLSELVEATKEYENLAITKKIILPKISVDRGDDWLVASYFLEYGESVGLLDKSLESFLIYTIISRELVKNKLLIKDEVNIIKDLLNYVIPEKREAFLKIFNIENVYEDETFEKSDVVMYLSNKKHTNYTISDPIKEYVLKIAKECGTIESAQASILRIELILSCL